MPDFSKLVHSSPPSSTPLTELEEVGGFLLTKTADPGILKDWETGEEFTKKEVRKELDRRSRLNYKDRERYLRENPEIAAESAARRKSLRTEDRVRKPYCWIKVDPKRSTVGDFEIAKDIALDNSPEGIAYSMPRGSIRVPEAAASRIIEALKSEGIKLGKSRYTLSSW